MEQSVVKATHKRTCPAITRIPRISWHRKSVDQIARALYERFLSLWDHVISQCINREIRDKPISGIEGALDAPSTLGTKTGVSIG